MVDVNKYKLRVIPGTAKRLTMSDADYFGDALPGYVSNSQLSLLNPSQGGSYEKFRAGFNDLGMNANSLELGSAVHALFLEKELYRLCDFTKPSGKVGPIIEEAFKLMSLGELKTYEDCLRAAALKNSYYVNSLTDNRVKSLKEKGGDYYNYLLERGMPGGKEDIILSSDMNIKCSKMIKNLNNDMQIMNKFFPDGDGVLFDIKAYYEDVITLEIEIEITPDIIIRIPLKGKIDMWSIDFDNYILTVNDLKTTGKECKYFAGFEFEDFVTKEKRFIDGSFQKFHYNRQVAMYSWMLWKYAEETYTTFGKGWKANANIGMVESIGEHNTSLMNIDKLSISKGFNEFSTLIKLLAHYMHYGDDV